jgi:hypothetical protein
MHKTSRSMFLEKLSFSLMKRFLNLQLSVKSRHQLYIHPQLSDVGFMIFNFQTQFIVAVCFGIVASKLGVQWTPCSTVQTTWSYLRTPPIYIIPALWRTRTDAERLGRRVIQHDSIFQRKVSPWLRYSIRTGTRCETVGPWTSWTFYHWCVRSTKVWWQSYLSR